MRELVEDVAREREREREEEVSYANIKNTIMIGQEFVWLIFDAFGPLLSRSIQAVYG